MADEVTVHGDKLTALVQSRAADWQRRERMSGLGCGNLVGANLSVQTVTGADDPTIHPELRTCWLVATRRSSACGDERPVPAVRGHKATATCPRPM